MLKRGDQTHTVSLGRQGGRQMMEAGGKDGVRTLVDLLVLCALCTQVGTAATWQAKRDTRDGVPWVLNPAESREGAAERTLHELWRLGGGDEEEFFGVVSDVFADREGNICLLDSQLNEIRIYSPDGELIQSMGRRGEGPGEFQGAGGACLLPGGGLAAIQIWPGKLIMFNRDGTPAGTLVPQIGDAGAQGFQVAFSAAPVRDRVGISCMNQTFGSDGTLTRTHILGTFDLEGKLVTPLLKVTDEANLTQGIPIDELQSSRFHRRWTATAEGTVYVAPEFYGYTIQVFDPAGTTRMMIQRDYQTVRRTAEEKETIRELFAGGTRGVPNAVITVEDSYPDIAGLDIGPDGLLWVRSSEGRWRVPESTAAVYDVFAADGEFVRQVSLRGDVDPREDDLYLLGDRVVVVRSFMSALRGSVGAGGEPGGEEQEEIAVLCFRIR